MKNSSSERAKISAFVVCCDEEDKIERALKSLLWCDEILVVDSGSKDRTLEIARRYTPNIIYNKWDGYREQKQFALNHCKHEWVLNIDSDEEVSPALKKKIISLLELPENMRERVAGFEISRVVYFLGRWWRRGGWYPEYRLRLFQRSKTRWGGTNPHEKAVVHGKVKKMKEELYHYTYDNISNQVQANNHFSSWAAREMHENGERASLLNLFINPVARFLKFYFLRLGILEGTAGLLMAIQEAHYAFLKYTKLWALERYGYEKFVDSLSKSRSNPSDNIEIAKN